MMALDSKQSSGFWQAIVSVIDITNTYSADIESDGSDYTVTVVRRERDGSPTELAEDRFDSYAAAVAFARRIANNDTQRPYTRDEIKDMVAGTKD